MWAAGLKVGLNHESTADAWRGGATAGQRAGATANQQADELGFPDNVPIYYTPVDQGGGDINLVRHYLIAAGQEGPRPVGLYWGVWQIEQLLDEGIISYGWIAAAYSWSAPRRPQAGDVGRAHLLQTLAQPTIGGTVVDVNQVLRPDWGGWHPDQEPPPTKGKPMAVIVNGEDGGVYLWDREAGTAKHLPDGETIAQLKFLGYQQIDGSLTKKVLKVLTGGNGIPAPGGY
jgi:hypothetical protein